jgi:hypothetical protein
VEIGRKVLGRIDIDPASSAKWNETIKAKVFYDGSEGRDGLVEPWRVGSEVGGPRVFLNSPGDKTGKLVQAFWERAVALWLACEIDTLFWVGFSLEQLVSLQKFEVNPLSEQVWTAILPARVRFIERSTMKPASNPSHGNYVTVLPSRSAALQQEVVWRAQASYAKWAVLR